MPLINDTESEGAAMVREWHEAAARHLRRAKTMNKYITLEQWWNGQMTVDRGVVVELSDARAAELMASGHVKPDEPIGPPGSVPVPTPEEDEPIGPPETAPEPQNRRVTTAGSAGPKRK